MAGKAGSENRESAIGNKKSLLPPCFPPAHFRALAGNRFCFLFGALGFKAGRGRG